MPLHRRWRSMDIFGSRESLDKVGQNHNRNNTIHRLSSKDAHHHHPHHHSLLHIINPFRHRLGSAGSKEDSPVSYRRDKKEEEPPDAETSPMIQRGVIIQMDEKGYGFTVSGDNPVFVASVKSEGAASRSGVQQGDKILKVNGTLVLNRNHLDVVKLIKSGSYVALTLLGKPNTNAPASPGVIGGEQPTNPRLSAAPHVTAPLPVNADKDRELRQQKFYMTKVMHETALDDYQKLQRQYSKNPSSEKVHAQLLEKERTVKNLENQLQSIMPDGEDAELIISACPKSNRHSDSEHGSLDSSSLQSWTSSLPTAVTTTMTSDLGSMSDSPQTSPSISPTPNDAHIRHNGQDEPDLTLSSGSPGIITIDDEDVNIGNSPANDPGPFVDIKHLENKPAHMAVLLRYLISNSDPSFVLFHIIAEAYSRSNGSIKELRKWAFEIHSTFVVKSAPLNIHPKDNVISEIENILTVSAQRSDNEMFLRVIFNNALQAVQPEIAELLSDFRSKRDLGMGNFYGISKLDANMDRQAEIRAAEEILIPCVEKVGHDEGSSRSTSDQDLAISWGVATFLRLSSTSKSHHSAILDRVQTFMMKEKRIKFTRSGRAKNVKSHQFNLQHFYNSTSCNFCGHNIWGVGYQGYMCLNCEIVLHKRCTDEITDTCGGKKKRPRLIPSMLPTRKPSTTSQPGTPVPDTSHGVRPHSELHSPGFLENSIGGLIVHPVARDDDSELAGLPTGHSVKHIVNRYQEMNSPTGPGPGLGVPGGTTSSTSLSSSASGGGYDDRRGSTDLNRSGSLNNKGEKGDRPARRAKSDVDVDSEIFKAINQSGSSSASSMSNRSGESPSNSNDNVHESMLAHHEDPDIELEPELPPLKKVLGEEQYRKLKPKERKYQDVINELIYTERAHLRNLKIMDSLFNKPMLSEKGNVHDLAMALFPNMEDMIFLHESLTNDLIELQKANPVVKEVGEILLKRFDKELGMSFRMACAEYCRNQSFALDGLKKETRKNQKLNQFLHDAETSPLCRRLQLRDLVPSQVHRLTKYPLLIDNLLKYTTASSEEHKRLKLSLDRAKQILIYVNKAVKECENYHRLKEFQKKIDKKLTETTDPAMADIKALDLTKGHKLIFDSPLTMKLKANRTIDLHVLLFDDLLVMLQKQDDRYLLKYQNSNAPAVRDSSVKEDRYTHSPVLYVRNILARHVATDKKSFFVVNMSENRALMYEFIAATSDLRMKWLAMINEQTEFLKKGGKNDTGHIVVAPPATLDNIEVDPQPTSGPGSPNTSIDCNDDLDQVDGLSRRSEVIDLIQPEEVRVRSVISAQATPVRSTEAALPTAGGNDDVIAEGGDSGSSKQSQISSSPYGQSQQQQQESMTAATVPKAAAAAASTSASASSPKSPNAQGNVSMPMGELKGMAVEMNVIIAKLMSTMDTGGEERQKWREELKEAQRQLDILKEQKRRLTMSGAVPPDRETELYDDEDEEIVTSPTHPLIPATKAAQLASPLSSLQSQTSELTLAQEMSLIEESTHGGEEVHHGIQEEAIMIESVETLASRPSMEMATMVGQCDSDGDRVIEVSMGDEDDDDDNEVSVTDLPLPDIGAVQAEASLVGGLDDALIRPHPRLLDAVDLDDSDDDDNDTLVSKGEHPPDLASLSSFSIDGTHPVDSSESIVAGPQHRTDSMDDDDDDDDYRDASCESRQEGTSVDGDDDFDDSKDDNCTPIEI